MFYDFEFFDDFILIEYGVEMIVMR